MIEELKNSDVVYARVMAEGTPRNDSGWMTSVARTLALKIDGRLKKEGLEEMSCLDLGCGVGELSRILASKGFKCVGVDKNRAFIEKARDRSPNTQFTQANFLTLDFEDDFSVVSASHDVFNMLEGSQVLPFMNLANRALHSDGLLIFDFITSYGFQTWQDIQIQEREDFFMLQKCIYNEENQRGTVKLTGFVKNENGVEYDRFDVVTDVVYHELEDVVECLHMAGFVKVETYNEWQGLVGEVGMDEERSSKLTIVATKG